MSLSHSCPPPSPPNWRAIWVSARTGASQITILLHRKPMFGASTSSLSPQVHGTLPVPRLQIEAPSPTPSVSAQVLSRQSQKPTPGQEEDLLEGHPIVRTMDGKMEWPWQAGREQAHGAARPQQPGSPEESTAKRMLKTPAAESCLCSPQLAELHQEWPGGRGIT